MPKNYDHLKLENQLCFPLYAASRETIKLYHPLLTDLDLTYTQYITMMVLWEQSGCNVKQLGEKLYLDSGTLTPVLKGLESKGYLKRVRDENDERIVHVHLTEAGFALRERAYEIPFRMKEHVTLSEDEMSQLYSLLYKLLDELSE